MKEDVLLHAAVDRCLDLLRCRLLFAPAVHQPVAPTLALGY